MKSAERMPAIVKELHREFAGPTRFMEVCGTHTMAVFRHGIRSMLPPGLELVSGPGCPVCVTPAGKIDEAIALAGKKGIILATFGDMLRVPGTRSSLEKQRAEGADVRVVYSCADALKLADETGKKVVFFAIGFETTSPTIAQTILDARRTGKKNFFVYTALKLIPPAMRALLESGEVKIDGFMCPGHVSAVIGTKPYGFIPRDYRIPCVVAGFEAYDILESLLMLVRMKKSGKPEVANQYCRWVRTDGNQRAVEILNSVFETSDAEWRGIGVIPSSGLNLRKEFLEFSAERFVDSGISAPEEKSGCRCGAVLRGAVKPTDCPLFGKRCTPDNPAGACMVSSEGTCAAYFRYAGKKKNG